nr:PilZ domain-containing protein [uncultured Agathobaculum sp.]
MSRKGPQEEKFVFLDDNHQTLAGAVLLGQQGQTKTFRLTYAPNCDLKALTSFNVMSVNSTEFMAWHGKVQQIRGDKLDFIAEERIDSRLRRHLRIPMAFRTYLYPMHSHSARLPIISKDISCGGMAFHCVTPLKDDTIYEIALPCTEPPIIIRLKVIRTISKEKNLYAGQFMDILPQEEAMVQESIFDYDLRHHTA